jgi:hypothetical protein
MIHSKAETLESPEENVVLFPQTRRFLSWCLEPLRGILETVGFATIDGKRMLHVMGKGHWGMRHIFDRLAFVGLDTMPMALLLSPKNVDTAYSELLVMHVQPCRPRANCPTVEGVSKPASSMNPPSGLVEDLSAMGQVETS